MEVIKRICVLILILSAVSSLAQDKSVHELVHEFSQAVILSDSVHFDYLYKHSKMNKNLIGNREFEKYITYLTKSFKSNLKVGQKFSVLSFSEVGNRPNLKMNSIYTDLKYEYNDQVYYLVNNDEKKLVWMFLVKRNKVISFFNYWNIGGKSLIPLPLKKRSSLGYIKKINKYVGI